MSWGWLAMFATGVCGWVAYGLITGAVAVIVTNVVTFTLVGALAGLKVRHNTLVGPRVRVRHPSPLSTNDRPGK